jgi:hypothetical protein
MHTYTGVTTRFLEDNERLVVSEEQEMPLVIEAGDNKSVEFLHDFLSTNAPFLMDDMAKYGAVLLRGFEVNSDELFEQTVLSIPEFRGISEAFMSENGRTPVENLNYVLHTNSVYKTGGTLYLGGFHTENYYSPDVPGFICFYCNEPSELGGETGIINTEKVYRHLSDSLKKKLEQHAFFVSKWLVSDVEARYKIDVPTIEKICQQFNLPMIGEGDERFILMYKPSVFEHPLTQEKALQLNLFQLPTLNSALRACFVNDYKGRDWFWHRFFWRLPNAVFNSIEFLAVVCIAFFHSPKNSYRMVRSKYATYLANKKIHAFDTTSVGACFSKEEVKELAQVMRTYYSSCLWNKGDVLLVDNRKVMHAGMPGKGERVIRAMICNPLAMNYAPKEPGLIKAQDSPLSTIGDYMTKGIVPLG